MLKQKTNRGAAKRFSRTGTGKYKRSHSHARHILTKKPSKRKRHLHSPALIAQADMVLLRRLLPYG